MKKHLSIVVSLAVFACAASVVVPFSPKAGGAFKLSSGGKLTRVEAFSPVSGGTVDLKSVYSADVYTKDLDAPKYLAPGERLIFSGTGVGGFVRLIFE